MGYLFWVGEMDCELRTQVTRGMLTGVSPLLALNLPPSTAFGFCTRVEARAAKLATAA